MIAKLGTWAAKLLGFFVFCLAFWKWGQVSAELKEVKRERDETLKTSQGFEEINSTPYVSNPASFLCDNDPERAVLPEDDKKTG